MADTMRQDDRLTVRFTPMLRQRLRAAARKRGVREADYVREAVERTISSDEPGVSAYDLALKSGLIGAVRDAPRDLSTNKGYFEGFGES